MSEKNEIRELADAELDLVGGGWGLNISIGNVVVASKGGEVEGNIIVGFSQTSIRVRI